MSEKSQIHLTSSNPITLARLSNPGEPDKILTKGSFVHCSSTWSVLKQYRCESALRKQGWWRWAIEWGF